MSATATLAGGLQPPVPQVLGQTLSAPDLCPPADAAIRVLQQRGFSSFQVRPDGTRIYITATSGSTTGQYLAHCTPRVLGQSISTPNGPVDPADPQGPDAPQGPSNPEVPTGPQGPTAPQGPSAPQGPTGPQGPTDPVDPPSRGNDGYGQEMHGRDQDGENPGSDKGNGVPQGRPGAGSPGSGSKPNHQGGDR